MVGYHKELRLFVVTNNDLKKENETINFMDYTL